MYIGINDDGFIQGTYLTEQDKDGFRRNVRRKCENFSPTLTPRDYNIGFVEIFDRKKTWAVKKQNLYVIEIAVNHDNLRQLYFTDKK